MSSVSTSVLFGKARSLTRRSTYIQLPDDENELDNNDDNDDNDDVLQDDDSATEHSRILFSALGQCSRQVTRYFLGFMLEEEAVDTYGATNNPLEGHRSFGRNGPADKDGDENDDMCDDTTIDSSMDIPSIWTSLTATLCASLALSTAATAVPVALITAMTEFHSDNDANSNHFVTRATAAAVWGTSVGKWVNGWVTDLVGARRTACVYSAFLSVSLIRLAVLTWTPESAVWACFWTEFCASVQWPTVAVTLATHYRGHGNMYEGGIYLAALAARLGSLAGIVGSSFLLNQNVPWRAVAGVGAWAALVSSAMTYLYGWDAPFERNQPQNPVDPLLWRQYIQTKQPLSPKERPPQSFNSYNKSSSRPWSLSLVWHWISFLVQSVVWPSTKHVLGSGVFWLVAVAHSGASMAQSSVRIVGSYLVDTDQINGGTTNAQQSQMSSLTVFLSLGTLTGLIIAGHLFAIQSDNARRRKWLVSKLYLTMIAACYVLAFLSIPTVCKSLEDLLLPLQVSTLFLLGFGISVPYYHLPSLVSANFPQHKALFLSLTEGVAYGIAGWLWRIVGRIVAGGDHGWAYGWASVALLLILTAILMVEFLEHYYCRSCTSYSGVYETIVLA